MEVRELITNLYEYCTHQGYAGVDTKRMVEVLKEKTGDKSSHLLHWLEVFEALSPSEKMEVIRRCGIPSSPAKPAVIYK